MGSRATVETLLKSTVYSAAKNWASRVKDLQIVAKHFGAMARPGLRMAGERECLTMPSGSESVVASTGSMTRSPETASNCCSEFSGRVTSVTGRQEP